MKLAVEGAVSRASGSQTIFGVDYFAGSMTDAVKAVLERAASRRGGYAVLCNVHVLMTAQRTRGVWEALRGAWRSFPDGAPIAWLERRLSDEAIERIGGPDLMLGVIDRGREQGLRHAFVGSDAETLKLLAANLRTAFPGVEIVGMHAPPYGPLSEWSDGIVERVRVWEPDIVWLALGAPKQELWMRRYASLLSPSLLMGVGAAFDFHAGTRRRAPSWMRKAGLEWAHRLAAEPKRLMGRYLRTNTAFLVALGTCAVRRDFSSPPFSSRSRRGTA